MQPEEKTPRSSSKPSTLGKAYEKQYKIVNDVLKACGDKVDCYLAKAAEPASQAQETQFAGIKSMYMVGVLGGPEVRQKLIELGQELYPPEQLGPEALAAYHAAEIEKWWPIVREAGIRIE